MSFAGVAIVGAVSAGTSLYSGYQNRKAADKAARQSADAARRMEARLDESASQVEQYANEYTSMLSRLDTSFDPYDMEQAFNSLYEAVIQPMERDFDQNVLPGIQAAYSGGVMGASAGLSGAAQEAESNARRGLSESKAQLRFQERGNAIGRNYAEYDRRQQLAGTKFNAQTAAPLLRANQAPQIYQAQSNTIAAQLAANQAKAAIPGQVLSGAMAGFSAGMGAKTSFDLQKYLQGNTPNTKTNP